MASVAGWFAAPPRWATSPSRRSGASPVVALDRRPRRQPSRFGRPPKKRSSRWARPPPRRPSRSARQLWRPAARRASRPRIRMRPHGVVGSSGDRHRAAQATGRPPAAPSAACVRGPRRTPAGSLSTQLVLVLDRKGHRRPTTAGNDRGTRPQLMRAAVAGGNQEPSLGVWEDVAHAKRPADMSPGATADPPGIALISPPRRRRGRGGRPGAGSAGRARGRTRPGSRRRSPRARPPG
jgi:hypothetical protein